MDITGLKQLYEGGEGYSLHVYSAGGGEGYTMHVHTGYSEDGYTPACTSKPCKWIHPAYHDINLSIQQAGKRDTPSLSTLLAVARNA
jgi:hypothetical protein